MPALSKKQQKFMGIVRSIQKGEQPASKFDKDARDAAKDMKKSSVKKFAGTKHKGLPVKKEILGKLKELIKQELSEYTYGVGDVVKDVNPTCPHHGAMGKVKSVNPRSVVFVVTNKGKNFKPGQELEKSHDQMKKMNENILTKQLSKMVNEPESSIVKFMKKSGLDEASLLDFVEKLTRNNSRLRRIHTTILKKAIKGDKKSEKSIEKTLYGESINEMSDKSKKIINKLGKKEKEMFMDMVDMMGFDQVMADYKKNPKAFKQALKDMSESVIQERNDEVQTGKDYTKLWLQSIGLIIKQANNLKGALGKHPVKRDINKLKAVENLFKKFVKPAIETERASSRHYAPNQTELKKYLSNSKFKVAIRILKQTLQSSNGYDENSWYDLDDKTKKLIEKMSKVLRDMENKLDDANLENVNESINEDGHTDVASAKRKVMIMVDDSNKLLNKLNGMNKEDSLPSWWSDKITLSQNYLQKATNYLLNPVESVNENLRPSDKKILMVIATELVKTQMKGKNKNQVRKELPDILSTMGTNDLSKKSPTNRFNKNKMISLGKGFDKMPDYDKKVFINTLMYNAGLSKIGHYTNEAKEPEVITQLRDIVKRKQFKNIKDPKTKKTIRVDMFTANAITQVYDAIKKNSSHRNKFESLPLGKMASLSFKMMK